MRISFSLVVARLCGVDDGMGFFMAKAIESESCNVCVCVYVHVCGKFAQDII